MACPKCGAPTWEDNFWSGCTKCSWKSSCEHSVRVVRDPEPSRNPYHDAPNDHEGD